MRWRARTPPRRSSFGCLKGRARGIWHRKRRSGQRSQSSGSDSGRRDASTERERRNVPKHAAESPENTVTVVGGLWPTERRQPPGQAPAKARARDIAPVTSMYDESQRLRVYGGWIVAHEPSCLNLRRRPQLGDDAGRSVRRSGSQPARYIRLGFSKSQSLATTQAQPEV